MKKIFCFICFLTICCNFLFANDSALDFSGDVRTKWKLNDQKEYSDHHFILESNFVCKYAEDNTWMETKAKLSLSSLDSEPFEPRLSLERIFVGFQLSDKASIEVGRNNLDNLFDSKVQYKSHFNGICVNFTQDVRNIGVIFLHGGPYIEDYSHNRLAAIGEICIENLINTNLNLSYSLTYHPYNAISQVTGKFPLLVGDQNELKIVPYMAFLRNHDTNANGLYFGAVFGEIKKANDLLVDINYQDASCVPLHDFAGVGKGIHTKIVYAITNNFHAQMKAAIAKNHSNFVECSLIYNW